MPEYVVKQRVPVTVGLPGEKPAMGEFSLAPQVATRQGSETILELLNSRVRVIPIVMSDTDSVLLLTRQSIEWVLPSKEVDPELVCPPPYLVTREESVHVTFNDGRTASGIIQMELPANMNRVSDFLNTTGDFFPLRTQHGVMLVNKDRVRNTRVHMPSPPPIYSIDEI